jgi:hypothetical protein
VSAILTLLFVHNPGEVCSPFLAPLRAATLRLLVAHCTEDIKVLLSLEPVDAIILNQDHLQDSVMAELKHVAPRTPVILLRHQNQHVAIKPPGIAAVCCADPRDEELLNALAIFLGFILGKRALSFRNHTPPPSASGSYRLASCGD